MQIRVKGKKVLFIRSEYITEKKRTIGRTVASQPLGSSTVDSDPRDVLTAEEIKQYEDWFAKRKEDGAIENGRTYVRQAPRAIKRIADALAIDPVSRFTDPAQADKIYAEIAALKKALKKAGFTQTKQTKKGPVDSNASDSAQMQIEV